MKIVLPCAGRGSRFTQAGYEQPKPLIDVRGKPMIERVIENLGYANDYIFLFQKEHIKEYGDRLLPIFEKTNSFKIVEVDGITEGAACTVLLAEPYIEPYETMIIANSDQLLQFNRHLFYSYLKQARATGTIITFKSRDPKHSFVKIGETGYVSDVREKLPISDNACVGIYTTVLSEHFFDAARVMIQKNRRVNGEFYVAPVYNILIEEGAQISTYRIDRFHCLGDPDALNEYLAYAEVNGDCNSDAPITPKGVA